MLFSTLIPTLLHLVFGTTAVIIHLLHGEKLADFLAATPEGHQFRYFRASLWLYGYGLLALALVITIVWGVVQLLHMPIATWLYSFTYDIFGGYGMQPLK
jgi:hypothetical protein